MKKLKPFLRWLILGATLFFILETFKTHWREVAAVRFDSQGWLLVILGAIVTFFAHVWSGLVWTWILKDFQQPIKKWWAIRVYLLTNIAKYLPGNVWHFYGRINAITSFGGSIGVATVSVLLEPLLMAAAALIVALIFGLFSLINKQVNPIILLSAIIGLTVVLIGVTPRILNPIISKLNKLKGNTTESVKLKKYPLLPLLGEIGFVELRGTGFLLILLAIMSIKLTDIPEIYSVFSIAWVVGLIVPGAPGGLGVFEATAIALLDKTHFSVGNILVVVALFRLVGLIVEIVAAGIAFLSQKYPPLKGGS